MTKVTTNKLVDLLRRSNLVDEAKLTAFLEKATAAHGEAVLEDQNRLAELLIAGQSHHPLAGRQAARRQARASASASTSCSAKSARAA